MIDECLDCGGETEFDPGVGIVCQDCGYVVETDQFVESEEMVEGEGEVDEL